MPHINSESKEISFKVVYYGPGESGKTTNLTHIHNALSKDNKGDLISLDTAEERTLFFDFFPLSLGQIYGYQVRFNMYTVPGQVHYEASRRLILDGADGVVFVVDSTPKRLADNVLSWAMMEENLKSYHIDPRNYPIVLQYNKRDCTGSIPIGTMEREFDLKNVPVKEAVAICGRGVMETINHLCKEIVHRFTF